MATAKLWETTTQPFKTSLDGRVTSSDTSIVLASSIGLVAPGVIVINRQDGQGNDTFEKMEYCTFTGISSNTLTGVGRAVGGSTARDHSSGALVESFLDITHWEDMTEFLKAEHMNNGVEKITAHVRMITATGVSGATGLKGDVVFVPGANITVYPVSGASGYSHVVMNLTGGAGGIPFFSVGGGLASGANQTPALIIEDSLSLKSISAALRSPASGATIILDVNKNFTSIFTDQNTRPMIPAGGTYVSTASIGTTSFSPGNIATLDVDQVTYGGWMNVVLET